MTTTGDTAQRKLPRITTIDQLYDYLYRALRLEHATIPPYLTALYSLHPESNSDARHIIRVVAVEEMLHLTLVANVMNAVGGEPDLTRPGFAPTYPTALPAGESDFLVDLRPFSRAAVETFLKIERPKEAPDEASRIVRRHDLRAEFGAGAEESGESLATVPGMPGMQFWSIGEFYEEIIDGIKELHKIYQAQGKELFTGDPGRQVSPEYFYSGGGEIVVVTGLDSAEQALTLIAEQGEGIGGGIYDSAGELAHYYRFQQLKLGRYYQEGDDPGKPSGPELTVEWDSAYPVKKNARLKDYPPGSELYAAAKAFNVSYAGFLRQVTHAFTGKPGLLLDAVWEMFRIRDDMTRLIHNPIPGQPGVHAGPTFELDSRPKGAAS